MSGWPGDDAPGNGGGESPQETSVVFFCLSVRLSSQPANVLWALAAPILRMEGSLSSGKCSHIGPCPQGACLGGGVSGTFMSAADPLPDQGLAPMSEQRRWATERLRQRAGGPLRAHGGASPSPSPEPSVLDGAARRRVERGCRWLQARGTRPGRRARLASASSFPGAPGRSSGGGRRGPLGSRGACLFRGLA